MLVESCVRREVQARFGGEFLETYRRNTARRRVLSLRLTAQYLVLFVAGLLGVFVCFAGMYMGGVPQGLCILFALAAGLAVTGGTFYLSRRFGPTGFRSSSPRAGIRGASSTAGPSDSNSAWPASVEP